MYLPRSILLLITYNLAAASAGGIRSRQLQGERIDSFKGATDLRGGSLVDPENAGLLEFAALRKVVLDGECSDVCDVASNQEWVCAGENSHLVCHQGETKCIPAVSFHTHCLRHNDTCGPCADAGEPECGTCEGQGECGIEEVEICHKKRTKCVVSEDWLGHCYNHGDTCGACPAIIEDGEDGGDDGDDGEDEGGELDASACAAPCSQEDSPALQACAEEDPNTFPICHKGKNTLCVGPDMWPGHCLRHSDTCGPCPASVGESREPGTGNGSIPEGAGDIPSGNSGGGGNASGNNEGDEGDEGRPDDTGGSSNAGGNDEVELPGNATDPDAGAPAKSNSNGSGGCVFGC
jgi:hypothetical protein